MKTTDEVTKFTLDEVYEMYKAMQVKTTFGEYVDTLRSYGVRIL